MHYFKRYSWQFLAIMICIAAFTIGGMALADAVNSTAAVAATNPTPVFDSLNSALMTVLPFLPVTAQQAVTGGALILAVIPHIAPWTPWTWDDRTIRYKNGAVQLLARGWNLLAGNYRRASNAEPSDK